MDKRNITQVTLRANEELVKRTKQRSSRYFHMVGREQLVNIAPAGASKKEWRMEGIDFIDALVAMTAREQQVVKLIKDCIRWDKDMASLNYVVELAPDSVYFDVKVDNSMPYNTFLKGFSLLFKKDFVRRVSKNKYMFNPELFVIVGDAQLHFDIVWQESKKFKSSDQSLVLSTD